MEKIINNETLINALEIYERKRLGEYRETPFTPSEKFERKMEKLIKSETNYYHKITRTKARRTAVAVAAAAALLASAMSVTAIRETILGFFISGDNNVNVIQYNTEKSDAYPETIEKKYTPEYIPEGYKLEDKTSDDTMYEEYYVKGESFLDFQQFTKNAYSSASDSEFSAPKKLSGNGREYIIRKSEDMTMLVWETEGYVFELTGFESESEMLKISASINVEGGEE